MAKQTFGKLSFFQSAREEKVRVERCRGWWGKNVGTDQQNVSYWGSLSIFKSHSHTTSHSSSQKFWKQCPWPNKKGRTPQLPFPEPLSSLTSLLTQGALSQCFSDFPRDTGHLRILLKCRSRCSPRSLRFCISNKPQLKRMLPLLCQNHQLWAASSWKD